MIRLGYMWSVMIHCLRLFAFIITGQAIFVLRDKITVVVGLHKTSSVEMAEITEA